MATEFISGYPAPLALPVGTPNGTEIVPADQVVGGVRTTKGFAVSGLLASLAVTYPTGLVTASSGFTVSGGNFTSRGILDQATANALTIASTGALTVEAPTSGVPLTVNGIANNYATRVNGASTSGQSFGLEIFAGTTSADAALSVVNQAATTTYLEIFGDGHGVIGFNGTTNTIKFSAAGAVTIPAAASAGAADTLTVTGSNAANALTLVSGLSVGNAILRINGAATTGSLTAAFTATNKPGTGTTITKWLPIGLDGLQYWVPCWAN
jgi:hypothetical protein